MVKYTSFQVIFTSKMFVVRPISYQLKDVHQSLLLVNLLPGYHLTLSTLPCIQCVTQGL